MKKILIGIFIGVLFYSPVISSDIYNHEEFLCEVRINTAMFPILFIRRNNPVPGQNICYRIDLSRWYRAPQVDWMTVADYIALLEKTFGNSTLTKEENAFCSTQDSRWTVAVNGTLINRPIYDELAWLEKGLRVEIGRADIGAVCEPYEVCRAGFKYHYVTNSSGMRGLTSCELTTLK